MTEANPISEAAFSLIENTKHHIFLTGKAGTGKTTFLHGFKEKTKKNFVVLAPTGIAAINAGGMTIHSFFRLPLRTFVPTDISPNHELVIGRRDIFKHINYREDRKKLILSLDVLIIDEASMLRADILDMMDIALRTTRKSQLPFGGVQMLFIGDLFQLPPVLRSHEEYYFRDYYETPFFYSAQVLQNTELHTVELTKVYRQKDEHFIKILEEIRSGKPSQNCLDILNKQYNPQQKLLPKGSISLCTHNAQADKINAHELDALDTDLTEYKCIVEGDFNEKMYPAEEVIRLKPGAQVMFIRNDTSGTPKYFNGKIGTVKSCLDEGVIVEDENGEEISVFQEEWTNKKYGLDAENRILESAIGSFRQLPLRLAWAVTIHKSQGLTFDQMTIDAQKGFASGQVYVALSRCRTLEGIHLSSPIQAQSVFVDPKIIEFHRNSVANDCLTELIQAGKNPFAAEYISQKLNPLVLKSSFQKVLPQISALFFGDEEKYTTVFRSAFSQLVELETIWVKLSNVLRKWGNKDEDYETNLDLILTKSKAAIHHFNENLTQKIFPALDAVFLKLKTSKPKKELKSTYEILLQDFNFYHAQIAGISIFGERLCPELESSTKKPKTENKKEAKPKSERIPNHYRTWQYIKDQCLPNDIAGKLGMSVSTIYTHISKLISENKIEEGYIQQLVPEKKIQEFREKIGEEKFTTLTAIREKTGEHFSFNEIRVLAEFYGNKVT